MGTASRLPPPAPTNHLQLRSARRYATWVSCPGQRKDGHGKLFHSVPSSSPSVMDATAQTMSGQSGPGEVSCQISEPCHTGCALTKVSIVVLTCSGKYSHAATNRASSGHIAPSVCGAICVLGETSLSQLPDLQCTTGPPASGSNLPAIPRWPIVSVVRFRLIADRLDAPYLTIFFGIDFEHLVRSMRIMRQVRRRSGDPSALSSAPLLS
jgi:hypothetical protein